MYRIAKPPHYGTRGPWTPPNITIAKGGGKRHKSLILPPKSVELDQSTAGYNEAVADGPSTADGFTALANQGDVNEKGATYDMHWSTMGREEM